MALRDQQSLVQVLPNEYIALGNVTGVGFVQWPSGREGLAIAIERAYGRERPYICQIPINMTAEYALGYVVEKITNTIATSTTEEDEDDAG